LAAVVLAVAPAVAAAQESSPAPATVVVGIGVGVTRGDTPLSVSAACPPPSGEVYGRTACRAGVVPSTVSSIDAGYPLAVAPLADLGVGVRLVGGFGFTVAGQWARRSLQADVHASLPSLIHPGRGFREVAGARAVDQERQVLHVGAAWSRVLGERMELSVSAGPSWFRVRQDLITDVSFTERYPFDVASFGDAVSTVGVGSAFGWHAALDLTYWLGGRVGIGSVVRYSGGHVLLDPGRPVGYLAEPVAASQRGVEVVGGFRVRF